MVMHGAHGSPMRSRLPAGAQATWVTGDLGRTQSGDTAAGELGYARNLGGDSTLKLALGRTDSRENTAFGGTSRIKGSYFAPELIFRLPSSLPLYATLSGYYNRGDAQIDRGYSNAGTPVFSNGNTRVETGALRVRLDWLDALRAGPTRFTPYTSVTALETKVSGYTESGGGFPVRWDTRSEKSTQVRLGVDAVHPVSDTVSLTARVEATHSIGHAADATGEVLGLYRFDLTGPSNKKTWARLAVGAEAKLAGGIATLAVNATTEGQTPRHWITASYAYRF